MTEQCPLPLVTSTDPIGSTKPCVRYAGHIVYIFIGCKKTLSNFKISSFNLKTKLTFYCNLRPDCHFHRTYIEVLISELHVTK